VNYDNVNIANEAEKYLAHYEEIMSHIQENQFLLRKNFFINTNVKLENDFLHGKLLKEKALLLLSIKQNQIICDYLKNKGLKGQKADGKRTLMKACKRILDHLPTKDLSRNRYIIEIPCITSFLRTTIIPLLEESKQVFVKAISNLKGENI